MEQKTLLKHLINEYWTTEKGSYVKMQNFDDYWKKNKKKKKEIEEKLLAQIYGQSNFQAKNNFIDSFLPLWLFK